MGASSEPCCSLTQLLCPALPWQEPPAQGRGSTGSQELHATRHVPPSTTPGCRNTEMFTLTNSSIQRVTICTKMVSLNCNFFIDMTQQINFMHSISGVHLPQKVTYPYTRGSQYKNNWYSEFHFMGKFSEIHTFMGYKNPCNQLW